MWCETHPSGRVRTKDRPTRQANASKTSRRCSPESVAADLRELTKLARLQAGPEKIQFKEVLKALKAHIS